LGTFLKKQFSCLTRIPRWGTTWRQLNGQGRPVPQTS
jgi:hypothetical protein